MGIRKTITNLIQLLSLKNAERLGTDAKGNIVPKQATDISGKLDTSIFNAHKTDANAHKALFDAVNAKITAISQLLTSNDTSLDELQEIVNYIKQNKQILDTLSISNIAGLETALATINSKITALQNAERKGVQYAPDIALVANTAKAYNLGTNELMSLKLLGSGTVQIGTTSSTLGDLGEITGVSGDKIELGSIEGTVYLKSTTSMSVKPKIFKP